DVEGMAGSVLAGAGSLIGRCRPVVFVEVRTVAEAAEVLMARDWEGYRCLTVRSAGFNPQNFMSEGRNVFGPAQETALLLVPEEVRLELPEDSTLLSVSPTHDLNEIADVLLRTPRLGDLTPHDRDAAFLRHCVLQLEGQLVEE